MFYVLQLLWIVGLYQYQGKHLEQKKQDSTRIAEVQEVIFEALVA